MDKCSVSVVCTLQIAINSIGLGEGPYQYILYSAYTAIFLLCYVFI